MDLNLDLFSNLQAHSSSEFPRLGHFLQKKKIAPNVHHPKVAFVQQGTYRPLMLGVFSTEKMGVGRYIWNKIGSVPS